ncbi:hypothetical protein K1719_042878 [Acacia pycnantha]|nr:hypothetical protein K1719_042878 [Acacia pycnantha]
MPLELVSYVAEHGVKRAAFYIKKAEASSSGFYGPKAFASKRPRSGIRPLPLRLAPEVLPSSSPSLIAAAEVVPSSTPVSTAVGTSPRSDPSPPSLEKAKRVVVSIHFSFAPIGYRSSTKWLQAEPGWSGDVSGIGMAFFRHVGFCLLNLFRDEDLHELLNVSGHLCRALGLSQAWPHLHGYYARASAESRALKQNLELVEGKVKQLAEEKEKVEAERDELKTELKSSQLAADKAGEDLRRPTSAGASPCRHEARPGIHGGG